MTQKELEKLAEEYAVSANADDIMTQISLENAFMEGFLKCQELFNKEDDK